MCKNLFCFRTIFDRNFFLIFFHSYFFSRVHPALSVHPSVRWSTRWSVGPSVGLSVRPSVFHTSFFSKFLYFFFHPNCSYKKNNVITSNSTPVPTRAHLGIYVQGLLLFCLPISRSLSFSLFFFFLSLFLLNCRLSNSNGYNKYFRHLLHWPIILDKESRVLRSALKIIGSNSFTRTYIHASSPSSIHMHHHSHSPFLLTKIYFYLLSSRFFFFFIKLGPSLFNMRQKRKCRRYFPWI